MSYIASRSGPGEAYVGIIIRTFDPHFQQRLHQVGEVRFVAKAFLLYGVFLQESAFLDIGWIASFAGWRR
jgi:hypothetical protein